MWQAVVTLLIEKAVCQVFMKLFLSSVQCNIFTTPLTVRVLECSKIVYRQPFQIHFLLSNKEQKSTSFEVYMQS